MSDIYGQYPFGADEQGRVLYAGGPVVIGPPGRGKTSSRAVIIGEMSVDDRMTLIWHDKEAVARMAAEAARRFKAARQVPRWRFREFSRTLRQVEYLIDRMLAAQDEISALEAANQRDLDGA